MVAEEEGEIPMRRMGFAALVAAIAFGAAVQGGAVPVGPVVNGEFEIAAPAPVKDAACAVAGDTTINVLPPDQNPHVQDPTDPNEELPWPWLASVTPCEAGAMKALHWSTSRVTQFGDYDGDGNREAKIDGSVTLPPGDQIGKSHNFWQAYPSPHQAYSADFQALRFRVEAGAIPPGASVQISLSSVPLSDVSPFVVIFIDCFLTFQNLTPSGSLNRVEADPVTATFSSAWDGCDDEAAAWSAADDAGKRALLGRMRIVQLSFWQFQTGAPVTLDGVELYQAKTIAGI